MKYLQLSNRDIPQEPAPSTIFPSLRMSEEGGHTVYRLAVLVSPTNELARKFLARIGFVEEDESAKLPGWNYFVSDSGGPMLALTDDTSAPAEEQRATYLTINIDDDEDETTPNQITVNSEELSTGRLQSSAPTGFEELSWSHTSNWIFRWGTSTEEPALSTVFPVLTRINTLPFDDEESRGDPAPLYQVEIVPLPPRPHGQWGGAEMRINGTPIVGKMGQAIDLGQYILSSDDTELAVLDTSDALGFSVNNLARLTVNAESLVIRYGSHDVTLVSIDNPEGTSITVDVRFPLVMAATDKSPTALALLIPLISQVPKTEFNFSFHIEIGEGFDWTRPLATFDNRTSTWGRAQSFWKAAVDNEWAVGMKWLDGNQLELGGVEWSIADLVGEVLGTVFKIGPLSLDGEDLFSSMVPVRLGEVGFTVPVELQLGLGGDGCNFCLDLTIDPRTFRLSANRMNLRLPTPGQCTPASLIDLKAFAIILPTHPDEGDYFSSNSVDGYLDFEKREVALFVSNIESADKPRILVPGGLRDNDFSQRLLFELEPFSPDIWPRQGADPVFLRINSDGLSLYAKVVTDHRPNVLRGSDAMRPLGVTPLSDRGGRKSEVVLIDNIIRKAVFFGAFEVPSVDDLVANVEIGMRQEKRGKPPIVYAEIDLDKQNGKPIAPLSAGYLQMQIDDLRARLEWNMDNDEWDLDVFADTSLFLSSDISNTGGLDDLKDADRLQVRNVNLLKLHEGIGEIALTLAKPLEFKCLDERFLITFFGVRFQWGQSFVFMCDEALIQWLNKGTLEVSVEVGGVYLEFSEGNRLKMRNPSRIGIDVTISDSVRYRGEVAWVDNDRERYFAATGTLAIEGLPEAQTLLKLGSGKKQNGQIVPNIVLYGSLDYEMQLFSGVVAKNFGAGIGINNRLTGIDERPTAEKLLANIDRIDPSRISGWTFVERNGFYLSIVGTTIIASNTGGNTETNVYVASLLLSIDLDLNIVAAGKLWLASSVDFVRQRNNWTRPALVGAVAILPRDRLLTAAIESRSNPAIESSKQLQEILNNGHIKLSFTLSPKLVDFFLEDVSYKYDFLGVSMLYRGSFRLAYFDSTLLVRASQMITGEFSRELSAGPGGFRCRGDVAVAMEFGGLLSRRGIAAYGLIAARLNLDVDAWIKIEFSFTIGCGRWKKRISFSKTFTLPSTRLELGLMGAVAFVEGGSFGFAGEVSISVTICGYRLSISPSLALNDGVIKDVRQRVAAFEGRLEAYRQQLLTGGQRELSVPVFELHTAEDVERERWLHYRVGNWHLVIPAPDEEWLTPSVHRDGTVVDNGRFPSLKPDDRVPFLNYVSQLDFRADDAEPVLFSLLMPWDIARLTPDDRENSETAAALPSWQLLEDADLIMSETVSLVKDERIPLSDYRQVSDPRVESSVREYWLDLDQVMLPEGVLPVRMKSAEQILQSGEAPEDFNSTYGRLVEYAWWSQRAIIQRRHQGADRSALEDLEHRRAVLLYQLLSELRDLQGLSTPEVNQRATQSPWQARKIADASGVRRLFGVVFQHEDELPSRVQVTRMRFDPQTQQPVPGEPTDIELVPMFDTEVGEDGNLRVQGAVTDARNAVHLLPPRQEFIVDREATKQAVGSGRLRVRLPVRFDKNFLANSLPVTSHFQVWRRLRGAPPVLVADQQLPPITFLEPDADGEPAVAVIDPYLATDEFRVEIKNGQKALQIPGVQRPVFGKTILEYAIKLIPVGDFDRPTPPEDAVWQPFSPYVPEEDNFPIDLAMVLNVDALSRPTEDIASKWTEFCFASICQKDETDGSQDGNASGGNVVTLALTHHWGELKQPKPSPKFDIEIWVEERPIADSGFYAGAAGESGVSANPSQAADVRQVSGVEKPISLDDKFHVEIEPVDDATGTWKIKPESAKVRFREGFSYLFFVRPVYIRQVDGNQSDRAFGRVRPLQTYLSRELPEIEEILSNQDDASETKESHRWKEPPRLRSVGRIEWIDASHVVEVDALLRRAPGSTTPTDWQIPISASILPFDVRNEEMESGVDPDVLAAQRRRISMTWSHPGWQYGGVELNVRDIDDSSIFSSRVCETSDASIYQQAIRDFSNDSAWRLTRREKSARLSLAKLTALNLSLENGSQQNYRIQQTLFLGNENPAIRNLSLRTRDLIEEIEEGSDWGNLSLVAADWVRTLNAYDRSALNLNDPALEELRHEARALIRYLFLGLRPPEGETVTSLAPDVTERIDETINDLLLTINEYQPDAADFDDSEEGEGNARAAFLDADFGRKLAAILRRRRVIGEDVLATMDDPLPSARSNSNQTRELEGNGKKLGWLPRSSAFEELRQRQQDASRELQRAFPHVRDLLVWFPPTEATSPKQSWAGVQLPKTLDILMQQIRYKDTNGEEDWGRREKAASVVAKATGLTLAVQRLERQFAAQRLVMDRRSHHRVIVRTDSDGTRVPEMVRLQNLLASADRATGDGASAVGGSESSIVALFNLYERMGFAIDLAAMDRLGQSLSQRQLLRQIRNAKLEERFRTVVSSDGHDELADTHFVYVIAPREANSEYRGPFPDGVTPEPNYAWIGSAFLRLVVVPKRFHNLLLGHHPDLAENLTDVASAELQDWLTMRGIETKDVPELQKLIVPFARTLGFVHPRDKESKPMPADKLLLIRLTPLELHHVSVPHLDGFAHVDWELPDRHGHRFEVSARAMSRYEPLLSWKANVSRPRLVHKGSRVSVRRVMTRRDGIDLPIPQPVSVIPHPSVMQFVISLSSAGIRSILNNISAVRTGYQGHSLNFKYKLLDHDDPKLQWSKIREAMVVATDLSELPDTPPVIIPTPRNDEFDTRLFRHERLIQLDEIPYFCTVSLDVHCLFDGDLRGPRPRGGSELFTVPKVDPARRLSAVIAYRQAEVVRDESPEFEIEVVLGRLGELALPQELSGGIPLERSKYKLSDRKGNPMETEIELWDDMLPDPALGYHFYYRVDDENQPESSESVYRSVVDLLMPWHPAYKPQDTPDAPAFPLVRTLDSDIEVRPEHEYPKVELRKVSGLDDVLVPVVVIKFNNKKTELFQEPDRRRMQVSCRGRLTPPTDCRKG